MVVSLQCLSDTKQFTEKGNEHLQQMLLMQQGGKFSSHLFVHYTVAGQLGDLFFNLFNLSFVMPFTVKDLLIVWGKSGIRKPARNLWVTVPACICWVLLTERNARCFEGKLSLY